MYKAKYQAIKILEILIDYRSSVRLRHLLNDFKTVRRPARLRPERPTLRPNYPLTASPSIPHTFFSNRS